MVFHIGCTSLYSYQQCMHKDSLFSVFSPILVCIFDNKKFWWVQGDTSLMMLSIFLWKLWLMDVFFGKMSIHILCPFFFSFGKIVFTMLSCMSSSYILDINLLLVIPLEKYLLSFNGCLFILLEVSFHVQKLLCSSIYLL